MKFLFGLVLYIALFAREYKKQNNKKNKTSDSIFTCKNLAFQKFIMPVLLFITLMINAGGSFAFCTAQTACRLSDIQLELEQNKEIEKAINDYFDIGKNIYTFPNSGYKIINYNDLFIYHTIV